MSVPSACGVWLTRPAGRNEVLANRLLTAGFAPLSLPALHLTALPVAQHNFPLPQAYQLVMFVSGYAAHRYFSLLQRHQSVWPSQTLAATVGRASAQAVLQSGYVPENQLIWPSSPGAMRDSEALLACLAPHLPALHSVLIAGGQNGRSWFAQQLQHRGIQVDRIALYRREPAQWNAEQYHRLQAWLCSTTTKVVLITSTESLDAMVRLAGTSYDLALWQASRFVVVHPRIALRLGEIRRAAGIVGDPTVKLCAPDDNAIFRAIVDIATFGPHS